jgi:hypothetical protein
VQRAGSPVTVALGQSSSAVQGTTHTSDWQSAKASAQSSSRKHAPPSKAAPRCATHVVASVPSTVAVSVQVRRMQSLSAAQEG